MSITNKITTFVSSGVLLAAAFTSTSTFADTLPNIIDESFPQFTNTVSISKGHGPTSNTWKISGRKEATFWMGLNDTYSVSALSYSASVLWNNDSSFNSGTVEIIGKIASAGISRQTLMTADLISFEWDGGSFLGFNTDNISCSADLNALIGGAGCTTAESIIIDLDGTYGGDPLLKGLKMSGSAITSVPLPAAVWLFISGLGLIGVAARRKQRTSI